jgi:hypothetical protein
MTGVTAVNPRTIIALFKNGAFPSFLWNWKGQGKYDPLGRARSLAHHDDMANLYFVLSAALMPIIAALTMPVTTSGLAAMVLAALIAVVFKVVVLLRMSRFATEKHEFGSDVDAFMGALSMNAGQMNKDGLEGVKTFTHEVLVDYAIRQIRLENNQRTHMEDSPEKQKQLEKDLEATAEAFRHLYRIADRFMLVTAGYGGFYQRANAQLAADSLEATESQSH